MASTAWVWHGTLSRVKGISKKIVKSSPIVRGGSVWEFSKLTRSLRDLAFRLMSAGLWNSLIVYFPAQYIHEARVYRKKIFLAQLCPFISFESKGL